MRRTTMAGLLIAAVAAAQETTAVSSEDGNYTLHLPADWKTSREETEETLRLSVTCEIPHVRGTVYVRVYDIVGGLLSPIGQASYERPMQAKDHEAVSIEMGRTPLAHLVVRTPKERTYLYTYLRKAGHGLTVRLSCREADLDALKTQLFAVAASLDAKVERDPPEPSGYDRVPEKNGLVYFYGPGVKKASCGLLHTGIDAQIESFEKRHGRIVRPDDEPLLVIVHKSPAEHEKYWPGTRTLPIFELTVQRRIYVVPFEKSDIEVRAQLAKLLFRVLYMERYGNDQPEWLSEGLNHLQYAEMWTGKKLPYLHPVFIDQPPITRAPMDVEPLKEQSYEAYSRHGFVYGFYFEVGPPEVRKAYAAFLADLAKTGDAPGALARHIKPLHLDPAKVQAFFQKTAKPHERK